jgi:tRNA (mo5U34)-methyltransferase
MGRGNTRALTERGLESTALNARPETVPAHEIRERVAARAEWYHTMELAPGVVTPGWFDTRSVVSQLPIPPSLEGQRCLDIATFDGFWAFELERRGASEVVAIDILDPYAWDWPANSPPEVVEALERRKDGGSGFELAREALGSSVRRLELSVYDLSREEVGEFDFVYLGSLLLHLRDPVGALSAVRGVCRERLLVVDNVDPVFTLVFRRSPVAALDGAGRPWWWRLNLAALVRTAEAAGFALVSPPLRLRMPAGQGQPVPRPGLAMFRSPEARGAWMRARFGDPHAALLLRPVGDGGSG